MQLRGRKREYIAMKKKSQIVNFKSPISQKLSYSRGFTLIELLIVIVIVGILSTLVIANFIGIRARARDAERKSDLRQIQTALQLYYADFGQYPIKGTGPDEFGDCSSVFEGGTTKYMQEIPCDPIGENISYEYTASNCNNIQGPGGIPCTDYTLFACLENGNDSEIDPGADSCDDEGRYSFTVRNP